MNGNSPSSKHSNKFNEDKLDVRYNSQKINKYCKTPFSSNAIMKKEYESSDNVSNLNAKKTSSKSKSKFQSTHKIKNPSNNDISKISIIKDDLSINPLSPLPMFENINKFNSGEFQNFENDIDNVSSSNVNSKSNHSQNMPSNKKLINYSQYENMAFKKLSSEDYETKLVKINKKNTINKKVLKIVDHKSYNKDLKYNEPNQHYRQRNSIDDYKKEEEYEENPKIANEIQESINSNTISSNTVSQENSRDLNRHLSNQINKYNASSYKPSLRNINNLKNNITKSIRSRQESVAHSRRDSILKKNNSILNHMEDANLSVRPNINSSNYNNNNLSNSLDQYSSSVNNLGIRKKKSYLRIQIDIISNFFLTKYYGVLLFYLLLILDSILYIAYMNVKDSKVKNIIKNVDKIFLVAYCLEPVLIFHKLGYFKVFKNRDSIKPWIINLLWSSIVIIEYFSSSLDFLRLIRYVRVFYTLKYINKLETLLFMIVGPVKEYSGIMLSIIYLMLLGSVFFTIVYSKGEFGICTEKSGPFNGEINDVSYMNFQSYGYDYFNSNDLIFNRTKYRDYLYSNGKLSAKLLASSSPGESNNNVNQDPEEEYRLLSSFEEASYTIDEIKALSEDINTNINNTKLLSYLKDKVSNKTEWKIRSFLTTNHETSFCDARNLVDNYHCPLNTYCTKISSFSDYFLIERDKFDIKYKMYISGDNIAKSFFYSFLVANLDGWNTFFNRSMKVLSPVLVFIHWFFIIVIIHIVLIKFPIGIMVREGINNENLNSRKEKIRESILEEIDASNGSNNETNYFEIQLQVLEKLQSIIKMVKSFSMFKRIEPFYKFHEKWNLSFVCYYVLKQPVTHFVISIISTANLFFLAFETEFKDSPASSIGKIFIIFTYSFILVFTLIAERKKVYTNSGFFFDLSLLIFIFVEYISNGTIFISCLSSFRAISFLFYMKELKTLGVAYRIIVETSKEIYKYCILLGFFLFYFIIFGQFLYKDKLKYTVLSSEDKVLSEDVYYNIVEQSQPYFYYKKYDPIRGSSPILNYDSVYNSFLTVFNLFIGDSWSDIFQDAYYCPEVNYAFTYIYFILSIFIMKVWLSNLALAILIFQFEKSRKSNMFHKILYEFTQKQKALKLKRTHSFSFKNKIDIREAVDLLDDEEEYSGDEFDKTNFNISKFIKPYSKFSDTRLKLAYFEQPTLNFDSNTNKLLKSPISNGNKAYNKSKTAKNGQNVEARGSFNNNKESGKNYKFSKTYNNQDNKRTSSVNMIKTLRKKSHKSHKSHMTVSNEENSIKTESSINSEEYENNKQRNKSNSNQYRYNKTSTIKKSIAMKHKKTLNINRNSIYDQYSFSRNSYATIQEDRVNTSNCKFNNSVFHKFNNVFNQSINSQNNQSNMKSDNIFSETNKEINSPSRNFNSSNNELRLNSKNRNSNNFFSKKFDENTASMIRLNVSSDKQFITSDSIKLNSFFKSTINNESNQKNQFLNNLSPNKHTNEDKVQNERESITINNTKSPLNPPQKSTENPVKRKVKISVLLDELTSIPSLNIVESSNPSRNNFKLKNSLLGNNLNMNKSKYYGDKKSSGNSANMTPMMERERNSILCNSIGQSPFIKHRQSIALHSMSRNDIENSILVSNENKKKVFDLTPNTKDSYNSKINSPLFKKVSNISPNNNQSPKKNKEIYNSKVSNGGIKVDNLETLNNASNNNISNNNVNNVQMNNFFIKNGAKPQDNNMNVTDTHNNPFNNSINNSNIKLLSNNNTSQNFIKMLNNNNNNSNNNNKSRSSDKKFQSHVLKNFQPELKFEQTIDKNIEKQYTETNNVVDKLFFDLNVKRRRVSSKVGSSKQIFSSKELGIVRENNILDPNHVPNNKLIFKSIGKSSEYKHSNTFNLFKKTTDKSDQAMSPKNNDINTSNYNTNTDDIKRKIISLNKPTNNVFENYRRGRARNNTDATSSFKANRMRKINSDKACSRLNMVKELEEEQGNLDDSNDSIYFAKKMVKVNNFMRGDTIKSHRSMRTIKEIASSVAVSMKYSKSNLNNYVLSNLKSNKINMSSLDLNNNPKISKMGSKIKARKMKLEYMAWPDQYSFFIFHRDGGVRTFMVKLFDLKYADDLILVAICINIIILILESPYFNTYSSFYSFLAVIDDFLTMFFFSEMLMRMIGYGLYFDYKNNISHLSIFKYCMKPKVHTTSDYVFSGSKAVSRAVSRKSSLATIKQPVSKISNAGPFIKNNLVTIASNLNKNEKKTLINVNCNACGKNERATLRDILNIIDAIINVYAIILFYFARFHSSPDFLESIKSFKALIALRPLVMIKRSKNLQRLVNSVFKAIPIIFYVFVIIFYIITILSILGHNFFYGLLGSCDNPQFINKNFCEKAGYIWTKTDYNYDRVVSVILIFFELANKEDWYKIVYQTLKKSSNFEIYSFYFILIMIVAGVFLINLAYAVIIDSFKQTIEQSINKYNISNNFEKDYFFAMDTFTKHKPKKLLFIEETSTKIYNVLATLIKNKRLQNISLFFNLINTLLHASYHANQPKILDDAQQGIFVIHLVIAILVISVKIYLYGNKFFFNRSSYIFDLSIIIVMLSSYIFSLFIEDEMASALLIFMRLIYFYKLIKLSKDLKSVLKIVRLMIPKLVGILFLLLMALVVFSVVAMSYFGKAKQGEFITANDNFNDFWSSSLFLLKCLIGGKWNRAMRELGFQIDGCVTSQTYLDLFYNGPQQCGDYKAWFFFIFYLIICKFLIMMLVVAVFVEHFIPRKEKDKFIIDSEVKDFFNLWSIYDKHQEFEISCERFVLFCLQLGKPFDKLFSNFEVISPQIRGNYIKSPDEKLTLEISTLLRMSYFLNGIKITNRKTVHLGSAIEYLVFKLLVGDLDNDDYYSHEEHLFPDFLKSMRRKLYKELFKSYNKKNKKSKKSNLYSKDNANKENNCAIENKLLNQEDSKEEYSLVEVIAENIIRTNVTMFIKKKKAKKEKEKEKDKELNNNQ